jgi:hypothetical protein
MAALTPAQTTAELQRKKNLGIAPTSSSNVAAYNKLNPVKPPAASSGVSTGVTGTVSPPQIKPAPVGGITPSIDAEIKRKAGLGIPLTAASPEKQSLYNQYQKAPTAHQTGANGLPSDLSWLGAGVNNEIAAQLAAYQGQQEAARLAMQQGVSANNAFLAQQLGDMQKQQVVAQDALQQQQNRFGGLYSGGLNYQSGQINSAFAQQQGQLASDIAARNNSLQQQYGTQANTIAQQISQLQASAPQVINEKIQSYLMQYADQYGTDPISGRQTAAFQNQNFNQGLANRQFDRGVLESDRSFDRGILESDRAFEYTQGRDQVADDQWMNEFNYRSQQDGIQNALAWASQNLNERQESRIASNQSSGGSGGSSGGSRPSTDATIQDINLPRTATTMETYIINNLPGGKNVAGPPSPNQLGQIEEMILSNPNLSDADRVKLYNRFGIPLPE